MAISWVVFAGVFAGALFAMLLRKILPRISSSGIDPKYNYRGQAGVLDDRAETRGIHRV